MEITKELLDSLTAEDVERLAELSALLQEAEEDVAAVRKAYSFKIGEDKITVWKEANNAEYLTHDGVWQARYLHQTYDLRVNVDSIFNAYKAERTKKKNPRGLVDNLADSASYFRSFAAKARKLI